MLDKFATPGAVFAMVADTYNVFEFCEMLGSDPEIKSRIEAHGATGGLVVIRPDSGDPLTVCKWIVKKLDEKFGSTTNAKGYKVLNNVRIIQGDGVNAQVIESILDAFERDGYSADNIAFGQGGALLQIVNRDDGKFAMKCSAICVDGVWRDVFKDPITDSGKQSKKGIQLVYEDVENRHIFTAPINDQPQGTFRMLLQPVYVVEKDSNGNVITFYNYDTLDDIRERTKQEYN